MFLLTPNKLSPSTFPLAVFRTAVFRTAAQAASHVYFATGSLSFTRDLFSCSPRPNSRSPPQTQVPIFGCAPHEHRHKYPHPLRSRAQALALHWPLNTNTVPTATSTFRPLPSLSSPPAHKSLPVTPMPFEDLTLPKSRRGHRHLHHLSPPVPADSLILSSNPFALLSGKIPTSWMQKISLTTPTPLL